MRITAEQARLRIKADLESHLDKIDKLIIRLSDLGSNAARVVIKDETLQLGIIENLKDRGFNIDQHEDQLYIHW